MQPLFKNFRFCQLISYDMTHPSVPGTIMCQTRISCPCSSCNVSTLSKFWIHSTNRTQETQAGSSTSPVNICCSWSQSCRNWPITESVSSPTLRDTCSPVPVSDHVSVSRSDLVEKHQKVSSATWPGGEDSNDFFSHLIKKLNVFCVDKMII